ncbi:RHS repeat-associated core domain-containing protein [Thiolinea disciformis]|uniref:RHS repeat-associated core domain-containing protein n=1 Tax=Thiolinea disciformis TaxID=125614 RepID=UPI00037A23DF|nr:RHS repeat-associated core domain-containing protein [Thiolinea disciformis]
MIYLHTDHLGTVRYASDSNASLPADKRRIWSWESDAFGTTAPIQDPDNDSIATVINLRFPGQYYDAESGLHYNWNRYYDPKMGRYISSDPIRLAGGLNTYGYVGQNPLNFTDPKGLFWESLAPDTYHEVGQSTDWAWNHAFGCTGVSNLARRPDFVNFQLDLYVLSVWGTFSRDGHSFVGFGGNKAMPNSVAIGTTVTGVGLISQVLLGEIRIILLQVMQGAVMLLMVYLVVEL